MARAIKSITNELCRRSLHSTFDLSIPHSGTEDGRGKEDLSAEKFPWCFLYKQFPVDDSLKVRRTISEMLRHFFYSTQSEVRSSPARWQKRGVALLVLPARPAVRPSLLLWARQRAGRESGGGENLSEWSGPNPPKTFTVRNVTDICPSHYWRIQKNTNTHTFGLSDHEFYFLRSSFLIKVQNCLCDFLLTKGFRARPWSVSIREGGAVRLCTEPNKDWTHKLNPPICPTTLRRLLSRTSLDSHFGCWTWATRGAS